MATTVVKELVTRYVLEAKGGDQVTRQYDRTTAAAERAAVANRRFARSVRFGGDFATRDARRNALAQGRWAASKAWHAQMGGGGLGGAAGAARGVGGLGMVGTGAALGLGALALRVGSEMPAVSDFFSDLADRMNRGFKNLGRALNDSLFGDSGLTRDELAELDKKRAKISGEISGRSLNAQIEQAFQEHHEFARALTESEQELARKMMFGATETERMRLALVNSGNARLGRQQQIMDLRAERAGWASGDKTDLAVETEQVKNELARRKREESFAPLKAAKEALKKFEDSLKGGIGRNIERIAHNTEPLVQLQRQTLGGGTQGRWGVTATELGPIRRRHGRGGDKIQRAVHLIRSAAEDAAFEILDDLQRSGARA